MSLWIKARLIFVMGCCLFGPLLLIFGCLQIIFHGDGSFEWLVSFIASLIMTVLLTEYVFKNVFQYNILQYKLPEGHDWHMINEKKRNDGYYCKECGVKIMFDWADRKYVEAICIGHHPDCSLNHREHSTPHPLDFLPIDFQQEYMSF